MSPRPPRISSKPVKTLGSNPPPDALATPDRKSTRLNSSHGYISYAVFCLKKKKHTAEWQEARLSPHRISRAAGPQRSQHLVQYASHSREQYYNAANSNGVTTISADLSSAR